MFSILFLPIAGFSEDRNFFTITDSDYCIMLLNI